MNGKDRVQEVKEGILRCLAQLGHVQHAQALPIPSPRGGKRVPVFKSLPPPPVPLLFSNETLLTGLLDKQLQIMATQSKLLRQSRDIVQDLKARNEKLILKCQELRKEKERSLEQPRVLTKSRGSSPVCAEEEQALGPVQKKKRRKKGKKEASPSASRPRFTVRHRYQQFSEEEYKKRLEGKKDVVTAQFRQSEQKAGPSAAPSTRPRKTRSSAGPDDLVPVIDMSWKRKRPANQRQEKPKEKVKPQLERKTRKTSSPLPQSSVPEPMLNTNAEQNWVTTRQVEPFNLETTVYMDSWIQDFVGDEEEKTEDIEVPSWRRNEILPSRRPSESEPMDENVFVRRHFKPEVDEKRRKRWDAQKAREDLYLQQLKERLAERKGSAFKETKNPTDENSEDEGWYSGPSWTEGFRSNLPDPNKICFVEVEDTLPINVFGGSLPAFPKEDFTLPSDILKTMKRKKNVIPDPEGENVSHGNSKCTAGGSTAPAVGKRERLRK